MTSEARAEISGAIPAVLVLGPTPPGGTPVAPEDPDHPAPLDRRVWQLAFARAVNTMGLSLVMTFLGIYVVETRGYAAWIYGVVALIANLGQSFSNMWAGSLSDRIGRRPLITGSLFIRSGVIALLGVQVLLHAPLWSFAANMVVSSALRGCFEPVAYALVADVCSPAQRVRAFGIQRMGVNLGWAIGPALGGVLTLVMPYGAVFFLAAVGMLIAGAVTLRVRDPLAGAPRPAAEPAGAWLRGLRGAVADRTLRLLLLASFLAAVLQTQMFGTLSIYLTRELALNKADVGLLYARNGATVLVLQVPALRLLERIGLGPALPWAAVISTLGFALIGVGSGLGGAAIAMLVMTAGEVVFAPAHQTAIAEVADPAHRGQTYGIVGFTQMLGIAIAPLFGGILLDTIGAHHLTVWLTIALIGAAEAACLWRFVRRRAR